MLEVCLFVLGVVVGLLVNHYLMQPYRKPKKVVNERVNYKQIEQKATPKHVVVIKCSNPDDYTDITTIVDGVSGGRDRSFTSYQLRDSINAFHLVKYGTGLGYSDKNLLEAIGASRINCEKLIDGKMYIFKFEIGEDNGW